MPFTVKFTSLLIDLRQKIEFVHDLFNNTPEWEKYENEEYKSAIEKQSIQLGGSRNEPESDPFEMEPMNENVDDGKSDEQEEEQVKLELPTKEQMAENLKLKSESSFSSNEVGKEEISEAVRETLLEEPVLSEYAANNYWRKDMASEVDELEKDYD
eukprot:TRINITY_DN12698_c0_g1_i1.p2 TRINITY_DN12698_c0_g1~~TRINITY_DN12698_c0_g1_i1.p2  ORF type:complete len:156 (+),score=77.76 TRINITY_DN12698_c0_g1_i1:416-883(+)